MGSVLVQNVIRASLHLVPTVSEVATAIEEVVVSRSEIRRIYDDGGIGESSLGEWDESVRGCIDRMRVDRVDSLNTAVVVGLVVEDLGSSHESI